MGENEEKRSVILFCYEELGRFQKYHIIGKPEI